MGKANSSKHSGNKFGLKHGHCVNGKISKTYKTWSSMMERCYTETHQAYANYGGRGIKVCKRWHEFENFLEDMGVSPVGLTLERIKVGQGYSPRNCKWATYLEQGRNRRNTLYLEVGGVKKTLSEWSAITGLRYPTIFRRVVNGWAASEVLAPLKHPATHSKPKTQKSPQHAAY